MIWGLRGSVNGYVERLDSGKVAAWLEQPGPRVCILKKEEAEVIRTDSLSAQVKRYEAEGWNFAKGRRLTLVALVAAK